MIFFAVLNSLCVNKLVQLSGSPGCGWAVSDSAFWHSTSHCSPPSLSPYISLSQTNTTMQNRTAESPLGETITASSTTKSNIDRPRTTRKKRSQSQHTSVKRSKRLKQNLPLRSLRSKRIPEAGVVTLISLL